MKSINLRTIVAGVLTTGTFALLMPQVSAAADLHQPGKNWDVFQSRNGEQVSVDNTAYTGTALQSAPGQDWDAFHSRGEGAELITTRQEGTNMNLGFGKGWDVFNSRSGDRI